MRVEVKSGVIGWVMGPFAVVPGGTPSPAKMRGKHPVKPACHGTLLA
jgi:hypothetical protein